MELQNSRTAQNLLKAFAGESQARNRYDFASNIARKEGLQYVANIFEETAENEKEHAGLFYKHLAILAPSAIEITASYPVVSGDTTTQLTAAYQGENEEWKILYPEFARIAKEEGLHEIARTFEWIAKVEKEHELRFHRLLDSVVNNNLFNKNEMTLWRCLDCGYVHNGMSAPKACPVCLQPQGFFAPTCGKF
jgi:rubrerythrin